MDVLNPTVYFQLISGDRYGFRPIPVEILMDEFDVIKKFATEESVPDAKILDDWYLLDENANPPHYVLQVYTLWSLFLFYHRKFHMNLTSLKRSPVL